MKRKKLLINITILRGALALVLGVMLLIQPVTLRPFLINFMGVYWLLGGLVSLRVAKDVPRAKGLRLAVGIMGVTAGVALLTRTLTVSILPFETLIFFLGVLISLTGALHIVAGIRLSEAISREWKIANILLGMFEIVFGIMVMLFPWIHIKLAYLSVAVWALLGGIIMLADGLRLRQLLK